MPPPQKKTDAASMSLQESIRDECAAHLRALLDPTHWHPSALEARIDWFSKGPLLDEIDGWISILPKWWKKDTLLDVVKTTVQTLLLKRVPEVGRVQGNHQVIPTLSRVFEDIKRDMKSALMVGLGRALHYTTLHHTV